MDEIRSRSGGTAMATAPGRGVLESAREAHRSGRLDEAEALYREAMAADGSDASALHLLGAVRYQRGDYAGAADLIGRAATLNPAAPAVRANLAEAYRALGQYGWAVATCREAIRDDPDDAEARRVLGQSLRGLGLVDEAVAELRLAASLRPDSALARDNLAGALREQREAADPSRWEALAERHEAEGDFATAVAARRRALALAPGDRARPHLALATALQEEGRSAEAEAHVRSALAIEPGSTEARVELGAIHEERGEFAEAEAAFRDAIRLGPTGAKAHARLASLLRGDLPDPDLDALEARIGAPTTGGEARARLQFARGLVLDARGDFARAAEAVREANALALASNRARGLDFDPEGHGRLIDGLIAAFGPDFFDRAAGAGSDSRRPVFIFGLPRTGSTLIEQVLAGHPEVRGVGELTLARLAFFGLPPRLHRPGDSPLACVGRLDRGTIGRLADDYLGRLKDRDGGRAGRVVDKMPDNYLYLGLLAALFPKATFIHCRRDPRDVALSCWMADFRGLFWANDPGHIAVKFRAHGRMMDHWRAALPSTIHEVDYEETVADLEGVARRLLGALGLDWDPACLEFHQARRVVRTSSSVQVRRPLHGRSVGRWRHYEREFADLFAAL